MALLDTEYLKNNGKPVNLKLTKLTDTSCKISWDALRGYVKEDLIFQEPTGVKFVLKEVFEPEDPEDGEVVFDSANSTDKEFTLSFSNKYNAYFIKAFPYNSDGYFNSSINSLLFLNKTIMGFLVDEADTDVKHRVHPLAGALRSEKLYFKLQGNIIIDKAGKTQIPVETNIPFTDLEFNYCFNRKTGASDGNYNFIINKDWTVTGNGVTTNANRVEVRVKGYFNKIGDIYFNISSSTATNIDWETESIRQAELQDFTGWFPCVFVNGKVQYKLNPSNYNQREDGKSADITTLGNDVMCLYPRRGTNTFSECLYKQTASQVSAYTIEEAYTADSVKLMSCSIRTDQNYLDVVLELNTNGQLSRVDKSYSIPSKTSIENISTSKTELLESCCEHTFSVNTSTKKWTISISKLITNVSDPVEMVYTSKYFRPFYISETTYTKANGWSVQSASVNSDNNNITVVYQQGSTTNSKSYALTVANKLHQSALEPFKTECECVLDDTGLYVSKCITNPTFEKGKLVYTYITNEPENSDFHYIPFTKEISGEYYACGEFLQGAYEGYVSSNKLYSSSGKKPTASATIATFEGYSNVRGPGYEQRGYFQTQYLADLYLLVHQNCNAQTEVGAGWTGGSWTGNNESITTGAGDEYGANSELIKLTNPAYMTDAKHTVKILGQENPYGSLWEFEVGVQTTNSYGIIVSCGAHNDNGTGYIPIGKIYNGTASGNYGRFAQGNNVGKWLLKVDSFDGSSSTSYPDGFWQQAKTIAFFGGCWSYSVTCGAFYQSLCYAATGSDVTIGARLQFRKPQKRVPQPKALIEIL